MSDPSNENGRQEGPEEISPLDLAHKVAKEDRLARLPKRFYKKAFAAEEGGRYVVTVDGRPVKTPARKALTLETRALAEAIAAEWDAQEERVDPLSMPLNKLACTALDMTAERRAEIMADLLRYAGSDLLCYRADHPEKLVEAQQGHWDPLLDWLAQTVGARLEVTAGIMPVSQPPDEIRKIGKHIEKYDVFSFVALQGASQIAGSVTLGLALVEGRLSVEEVWTASRLDEDHQAEEWGWDQEAAARAEAISRDLKAIGRFISLCRTKS